MGLSWEYYFQRAPSTEGKKNIDGAVNRMEKKIFPIVGNTNACDHLIFYLGHYILLVEFVVFAPDIALRRSALDPQGTCSRAAKTRSSAAPLPAVGRVAVPPASTDKKKLHTGRKEPWEHKNNTKSHWNQKS